MQGKIIVTLGEDGSVKTDSRALIGSDAAIRGELKSLSAAIGGRGEFEVEKHVHRHHEHEGVADHEHA